MVFDRRMWCEDTGADTTPCAGPLSKGLSDASVDGGRQIDGCTARGVCSALKKSSEQAVGQNRPYQAKRWKTLFVCKFEGSQKLFFYLGYLVRGYGRHTETKDERGKTKPGLLKGNKEQENNRPGLTAPHLFRGVSKRCCLPMCYLPRCYLPRCCLPKLWPP